MIMALRKNVGTTRNPTHAHTVTHLSTGLQMRMHFEILAVQHASMAPSAANAANATAMKKAVGSSNPRK